MIQDNVIVAHEAFHLLKLEKRGATGAVAVTLDFNKAYDRVQQDFLSSLLLRMGFDAKCIQWIIEIVTTVSFSVFANGLKRNSFISTRGLKQGDPLFSHLFVLVVEALSISLTKGLQEQCIMGLKIKDRGPTLIHLFFTDDTLLFAKVDVAKCQALKQILDLYSLASGQLINFDKSRIVFSSNTSDQACLDTCGFLGIPPT